MSQAHQEQLPGPPAQHENMIFDAPSTAQQPPPPPPPPAAAITAINSTGTISRAPVRYNLPAAPSDMPATEAEFEAAMQEPDTPGDDPNNDTNDNANEPEQRSLRPGQKGFAERFMSRYGWTKGSGLGATGSGIINPLRVQVEKQSKKNNKAGNESGGWLGGDDGDRTTKGSSSSSRGKIIGGKKKKGGEEGAGEDEGLFGRMSEVVVLRGMVDGLDLDAEMHGGEGDGGLMQEIGEECSEKVSSFLISIFLVWEVGRKEGLVSYLYWFQCITQIHRIFFFSFSSRPPPSNQTWQSNPPSVLELHHLTCKLANLDLNMTQPTDWEN